MTQQPLNNDQSLRQATDAALDAAQDLTNLAAEQLGNISADAPMLDPDTSEGSILSEIEGPLSPATPAAGTSQELTQQERVEQRRASDLENGHVVLTAVAGAVAVVQASWQLYQEREKNVLYENPAGDLLAKIGPRDVLIDTYSALQQISERFDVRVPENLNLQIDGEETMLTMERIEGLATGTDVEGMGNVMDRTFNNSTLKEAYAFAVENFVKPIQEYLKNNGYWEELNSANWGIEGETLGRWGRGETPTADDIIVYDPVY